MHQNPHTKRRKKRIFQGTKTVTVVRGKVGYGFTISGQNPCMLSCIVPGSPAESAGLKPGDLLYVVNGLDVSKACHDDVVRMVGLSTGTLELQVGENHNNSDSSDDDYPPRCKSRYPNRVRPRHAYERNSKYEKVTLSHPQEKRGSLYPYPSAEAADSDLSSSLTSQDDHACSSGSGRHLARESSCESRKESGSYDSLERDSERFSYASMQNRHVISSAKKISLSAAVVKKVPPVGASLKHGHHSKQNSGSSESGGSVKAEAAKRDRCGDDDEQLPTVAESVRAVVGYIGSIETPSSHTRPHQRLQALRNAVRRLRVEKRVHTLVLMEVNSVGVVLTNAMGKQLALYPCERIAFSGICPDDERFFGLVTLGLVEDDASSLYNTGAGEPYKVPHSSCHIFMIEPELSPHSSHSLQAEVFQINCTKNPQTRRCDEFPRSATSLILCIANLYRDAPSRKFDTVTEIVQCQALADPAQAGNERNVSSSHSNNSTSDSGLGFTKEEAPLEQNEQVCIVDVPAGRSHHHNNSSDMSVAMDTSVLSQEIDVVSTPTAPHSAQRNLSAFDLRRGMNTSTSSEECWQQASRPLMNNRLTPRAMPDPSYPPVVRSKSSESLLRFSASTHSPGLAGNTESLRQSMQRLLQARHQQLQEQNMQLGSDGESHSGEPPLRHVPPPVLSLSVAEDGMAVLESEGAGADAKLVVGVAGRSGGSRTIDGCAHGGFDSVGKKDNNGVQLQQDVFAVPTNPPPNSVHNHALGRTGVSTAVRSAFQVPRPVSAPLSKQRLQTRPEMVDMDMFEKLSPRALPHSSPSTASVFRSPSAPPAPFFPHRDSDDDDDDDEDEEEEDPFIRQILRQFSEDRKSALDDDSRRFSEGFALSQKRDKERQKELQLQVEAYTGHQKWTKTGSLRRAAPVTGPAASLKQSFSQSHESLAVGDDPPTNNNNAKLLAACSVNNIASQTNGHAQCHHKAGRVASWAVNFQNLLSDPIGIDIFTEFLQKEFSEENIIFWKACEQYKQLKDDQQLKLQAQDIYSKYLSAKASDPVNVDSSARCHTEQFLDSPTSVMFDVAQQQIFQLMRQDSYSRFLKSELYKERVMDEMAGKALESPASAPSTGDHILAENGLQDKKKGKGKENEDKRRRSILPWRNGRKSLKGSDADSKKAGKKGKEDKEKDAKEQQPSNGSNNLNVSLTSVGSTNTVVQATAGPASATSASLKKAPGPGIDLSTMRKEVFHPKDAREGGESQVKFCRIVMPDGSTTVVCAKPGQTTRYVLGKLCEKRSISLASVDVFLLGSEKLLDLNEDISNLGSKEIVIERRVMFRLDMPSGKSIGVKAKPNRSIRDVFRPILNKYGFQLENIAVRLVTSQEFLDLDVAVSELDKQRAVIVNTNTDVADWVRRGGMPGPATVHMAPPSREAATWRGGSLEEITNKIFEDLMRGKSQLAHGFDELGVLELDKAKV